MHGYRLARQFRVFCENYAKKEDEALHDKVTRSTDGEKINLQGINDYSGQLLKDERLEFDTKGILETIHVCPSVHGGLLDFPGLVTKGVGNVIDKWEKVWREKEGEILNSSIMDLEETNPGKTYHNINKCVLPSPGEGECFDNQAFFDTVEESADKLWLHTNELSSKVLQKGEHKYMLAILGSVALTRNAIWIFNEQLDLDGKTKPFAATYTKWVEFTDALAQQVLEYETNLVATVVLYEPESQDWSNSKAYQDGERPSKAVQFWWLHMQALRTDVFNYLPPKIATKLFASVVNDSLSILAVRYSQAKPALRRVPQFRADLVATLLCAIELSLSCVDSLYEFFQPTTNHKFARSIHAKCQILTWNLVLIGCPLKTLHRVSTMIQPKRGNLAPLDKNREETLIAWLHFIHPGLFASQPDKLAPETSVYLSAKMAAYIPGPAWPLVVKCCLSHDFLFPTRIMTYFGGFVPGILGSENSGKGDSASMTDGCGSLLCRKACLSSADLSWPQVVGSGVLYIVMHSCPDKDCLIKVLEPCLRNLEESGFEVLDRNIVWNSKRPVWFQAVCDLLEPYFHPILEEILEDGETGRINANEAVRKVTSQLMDVAAVIPPSFFQACELIEGLVPDTISPLCDSVIAHIMICGLYNMIDKVMHSMSQADCPRDKKDYLIAISEGLLNVTGSTEMQRLEGLTDASANAKTQPFYNVNSESEELSYALCEMIAYELIAEPHGTMALTSVHRFITYNSEWIGQICGAELGPNSEDGADSEGCGGKFNYKITPWGYLVYKNHTCLERISTIGGIRFEKTMGYSLDWEKGIQSVLSAPDALIQILLNRRGEVTESQDTDESERKLLEEIRQVFRNRA